LVFISAGTDVQSTLHLYSPFFLVNLIYIEWCRVMVSQRFTDCYYKEH